MHNARELDRQPPLPKKTLAIAMSALLGGAQSAGAQQVLEEIVVTATKREASLQDIPLSITAFTTDEIGRRGFKDMSDYTSFVPGLAVGRREPGGNSVVFRGAAASGIQFGSNPSSGVYLDEQPITAAGINPDPRLVDIERVEALSGPQGTLFGDASQSGTLRIITNKPDAAELDSWAEATGSKVDGGDFSYDVNAMLNLPVVRDRLAVRLVGFRAEEAGYIDNVLGRSGGDTFDNANQVEEDVNSSEVTGGRVAVRWTPNSDWTLDLSGIYQDVTADGFGDTNLDAGDLEQVRFHKEELDEDWYQLGVTLEGRLGAADTLLHASYFNRDYRYEADGTDYQFAFDQLFDDAEYTIYDFGGDPENGFAINDIKNNRWTVEARLSTPADSGSKWFGLVGLFYNRTSEDSLFAAGNDSLADAPPAFYYMAYNLYFNNPPFLDDDETIPNPDFNPDTPSLNGLPINDPENGVRTWEPNENWFFGLYDETIEQFAVFGELNFDLTENFTVTAGGRWFHVDTKFRLVQGGLQQNGIVPNLATDLVITDERINESTDGFVPKFGATWRYNDDVMFYFTYSQGFRSGGGNGSKRISGIPLAYEADKLKSLEAGVKATWLDGRLRANLSAYTMDWDNVQVQVDDPNPFVFSLGIVNFPEAEIDGFEFDFNWLPLEGLDLGGTVAYNDARISQSATLDLRGHELSVNKGDRLPITPKWKASMFAEYSWPQELFGAQPYLRFDYAHTGRSINALPGLEAIVALEGTGQETTIQHPYDVGNFSMGLDGDSWSVALRIDNVWDERGTTFVNNRWGERRFGVNQPRTFGVTLRKSLR